MATTSRPIGAPLQRLLDATEDAWAADLNLQNAGRRLLGKLPAGLDRDVVVAFFEKMASFGRFPLFSAAMPNAYFEPYAWLRIERSRQAFRDDRREDLFSVSAFLFACVDAQQMSTYDHVRFGEDDRLAFLQRQRLVEAAWRFVAIPYFKLEAFQLLAEERVILDAARTHLANPWFLRDCELVASGQVSRRYHRFDIRLWAAAKLVLRLAGEPALAPGPEPTLP